MSSRLAPALTECGVCHASIEPAADGTVTRCYCGIEAQFLLFPALEQSARFASAGELLVSEQESPCFFHSAKRASAACDTCGRFVCDLCRIRWGARTVCPSCLAVADRKTTLLTRSRTNYDSIALAIALLAILLWPFSLFTAPVAIACGILALRKPGSLVRRYPVRAWAGIVLGTGTLAFWGWLIVYLVLKSKAS